MLAADLAWDQGQRFQFVQDQDEVGLSIHEHRLVIGSQVGSVIDVPPELTFVRDITANVKEYESSAPLTKDFVSSINALSNVAFTTTVFVHDGSSSEAVLLNEIIIALNPTITPESFFAQRDEFSSFRPLDGTPDQFIATVKNGYGPTALEVGIDVSDEPGVSWMSPNFYQAREKYFTPNDPRYPNQWHLNNFGQSGGLNDADSDLPEAWDVNQGGSANVVIGIIDDGVDSTHPDLNVWTNPGETNFDGIDNDGNGWVDDIRGWNFVTDTNQTEPVGTDRHGTAVAGVAAARGDNAIGVAGAAYRSRVMSIKIFDAAAVASDASIASAIYYAGGRTRDGLGTWKSADLVNSSWGGGASSTLINAALSWGTTSGRQGVGAAYFFASGNDAASTVTGPAAESNNIPGVIAVGATNNLGGRSDYSNYGASLDLVAPSSDNRAGFLSIDTTDRVGAPGFATGDYTGIGGTGFGQTSSASALAAGIGALVLAQASVQGVTLSPTALRSLLRNSTDLIGGATYDVSTGKNNEYGFGRVNAATAVAGVNRPEISVVSSTTDIVNRGNVGFSPIAVGLYSEVVLRIRNQGTQPLTISSVDMTGPFAVENLGSNRLNVGESTTLTLRFLPSAAGSFLGRAVINSNDADEGAFELNLFGSVAQTSIAGTVYEDYDGDSVFDSFERFLELPNDFAYIDANNNGTREANETSVPIANGGYAFESLAAGTYTVRTEVAGWTVTQPGKNGYLVTLVGASDSVTGTNFGYSKNDRLYSYVYEEINRDGAINPGEPALPGFTVSGSHAYTQTNTTAVAIPARGAITSTINVPDPGTVVSVVVLLNVTHPFISDLTLTLTAPDGTTVLLAQGVGGSGDNFTTTRFSDAGATPISAGTAPFTGIFRPQQALSLFRDVSMLGAWKLTINDVKDFDAGQLVNWSLEFQRRFFGVSDQNGWALVDLPTGTNTVGIELQPDWLFSRPAAGTYSIVSAAAPVYDRPFGIFYDNVAPTNVLLSNNSVDENQPVGTPIGDLSSIDPNRFGNTFSYTLVAGVRPNDNAQFRIVGNALQTNASFNFEVKSSYLVRIRTTDAGGKFFEKEFTISINNVNDSPSTINLSPQSIDENKPVGSLIGTFTTTDDDAGDTHTYSLATGTGSADNASFALNGNTLVTAALFNFEARSAYSVRVRTTDAGGRFFERAFAITINDIPDPTATIAGGVFEDYNGDGVYDPFERLVQTTTAFAYIDTNDNGIWESTEKRASVVNGSYLIDGLAAGSFVVRTEVPGHAATFPDKNRHLVTHATDLSTATGINFGRSKNDRLYSYVYEEINQDGILNAGEPALPGFAISGVNAVTVVNSIATPIPARGSITSSLNVVDTGTIVSLAVLVNIDHTWDSDLTLTLTAPDGRTFLLAQAVGGNGDNFTNTRFADSGATLIGAGSPPFTGTFRPQQALSPLNTMNLAGTWTLSIDDNKDFDSGLLRNWQLEFQRRYSTVSDANGWALLDLPSGTNTVGIELQPDWLFSRPASGNYSITSANTPIYNRPFGIFYGNVAPTNILLSNNKVEENQPIGTPVGDLSSVDPNRFGNTFTYTLVAGPTANDNVQFRIVGNVLQSNAVFNFETKSSYVVRIRTTDAGGKFFEKEFTITIENVVDNPTGLSLTPQSIDENKAIGSLVGVFATVDDDTTDTFTYTLVSGTGSTDNASFAISGNTLVSAAVFNFEAKNTYSVRVRTTDSGGKFFERAFDIAINDLPDLNASIIGNAFEDFNGDGIYDSFERLMQHSSAFVYVDNNDNGVWETTERRANIINGAYLLDGLSQGTYILRSETPGFATTFPDKNRHLVNVPTDLAAITGINFGRSKNDRLYSYVYEEINQDGVINPGEPGLPGFAVSGVTAFNVTNTTAIPIPVRGTIVSTINVTEPGTVASLVVLVNIDHTWDSDLTLTLTAPDGRSVILAQAVGGSGDNFTNTRFGDAAANPIGTGTAPFTGAFRPQQALSTLNAMSLVGAWTLSIEDNKDFDSGVLRNWSLEFQRRYFGISDANGWALVDLPSGTNTVGVELQPDWLFSRPATGTYIITSTGTPVYNRPYGVFYSNVAPTDLLISNSNVDENLAVGSTIGILTSIDPNRFGNTFTYTFVTGSTANDNAQFQLIGDVLQTNAVFNFEVKNSYVVRIRTTDAGGKFFEKDLVIKVRNVNDTPTALSLTPQSIAENLPAASTVGLFSTTDEDVADTHTYSLVAGTGSTNNASFSISGKTLVASPSFDFETKSSYSIRVRTQDQIGASFEEVFVVTIVNVNEAATSITLSKNTVDENKGANFLVGLFSNNDPDAGDAFTYSLVSGTGSSGNGSFAIAGNQLRSAVNFDFETQNSYSIRVRVVDRAGLSFERVFTINILNVNEGAGSITLSSDTILENELPGTLIGLLATDDPDTNDPILFQFVSGAGSDDNFLFKIQGDMLQSAVTFDFEARNSYIVRIRATDLAGLFIESNFVINVLDVNDKPTNILLSGTELFENDPVPTFIGNFLVVDADSNDSHTLTLVNGIGSDDNGKFEIAGSKLQSKQSLDFESQRLYSIRVRATDANGLLIEKQFNLSVLNRNEAPTAIGLSPAEVDEGLAIGTTVGVFSTTDVDVGDKHQYELVNNTAYPDNQKFLIVGQELRTGAVFNFDVRNSYSLLVRSSDEGGLFVEKVLTVAIKNVNSPPSDIGLLNRSIAENLPLASLVGAFTTTDPDGTDSFTYSLVAGNGALNNGSFAIVGNQLLTNAVFDFETKADYSIRVQSRDSAGVIIQKVFTINVTNVNETPTGLTLSSATIPENSVSGTVVGSLLTQDPDAADTFTYTLVSGIGAQDNAQFTIVGSALRSNTSFDFETKPTHSVRVKSVDAGGLSAETVLVISVTNVNEAPFNLTLAGTLLENTPLNVVVLTASASDLDAGDVLTYSFVSGLGSDDNTKFAIAANGGIRAVAPVDFESQSSYSLRVKATDVGGLSVERAFTVAVVNQNDAPSSIALTASSLNENAGPNAAVGSFSTVDQDGAGTFTYSLVSGAGADDNARFSVDGNALRALASFDFETKNSYTIRVRSADTGGLFVEESFVITIVDVNEAPTSVTLTNSSILENAAANTVVGSLSTTDVDAGDSFVYTLVAGVGSTDNSSFAIVNNQLQSVSAFDFEAKQSYSVRIRSTDRGGLTTESPFSIAVVDANELPANLQLSNSNLNENLPVDTLIGLLSAVDPDSGDSLTFRFATGINDNAKFRLTGNQLLSAEEFNFEAKFSYRLDIQVIDKSSSGPTLSFVITINDINEAVTNVNLSSSTLDENIAAGSLVGLLNAVDPDTGDSHQFALVDGIGASDNSKFTIVGNELRIVESPNFEAKSSYAIRVRGTDRGGLSFVKNFVTSVRDLPEAPTAIALSNFRINENQGIATVVGALSATDPDAGDTTSYSFVTGFGSTNNDLFQIVNGNLIAKNAFDFETTPNLFIRLKVTDSTQQAFEDFFVIVVDNRNETPTNITAPNKSVAENQPAGTVVSVLSTTDSDVGETYTYSLVPTPTTGDNIRFTIVGNELRTNRKLNFEVQSSHQLRIRSTDSTGLFVEVPFTVSVTDVNEAAPVANTDSARTTTNRIVVIDVLANDRDTDGVIDPTTVTIVSAPTGGTARVLSDGRIEFTPPADLRLTTSFTYTVKDNDEVVSNTAFVNVIVFAAFQNQLNKLDVDADGSITPLDVLTLVNDINTNGLRDLPNGPPSTAPFLDVNGNGKVDPLDVLEIVNFINSKSSLSGEGEATVANEVDLAFASPDLDAILRVRKSQESMATSMLSVDDYYQNLDPKRNKKR